jgi:hypothetical protein
LFTDNIVTMVYINKMGGKFPHLRQVAERILRRCEKRKVVIAAEHVPGVKNRLADKLSREPKDRSDWKLNSRVFQVLDNRWGPHTVDFFATRNNTQLPRFACWRADELATFIDGLKNLYRKENGYANPPFAIIGQVLGRLRRTQRDLTLVVPAWPAQHWWPVLLKLMVDVPVLLPDIDDLFKPSHGVGVVYRSKAPPGGLSPSGSPAALRGEKDFERSY